MNGILKCNAQIATFVNEIIKFEKVYGYGNFYIKIS